MSRLLVVDDDIQMLSALEAALRHKIWIVTDRMLRQFLDGILSILLFDEGPAHNCQLFFQTPRSV